MIDGNRHDAGVVRNIEGVTESRRTQVCADDRERTIRRFRHFEETHAGQKFDRDADGAPQRPWA